MALNHGRVHQFVLRNDRVDLIAGPGAKITMLKNGTMDTHAFIEAKTTRFIYNGKDHSAEEFEKLVSDDENKAENE